MRAHRSTPALAAILFALSGCSRSEAKPAEASPQPDTTVLESLHRAEQEAIATYRIAIERYDAASLALIRDGHDEASERLRARMVALEAAPVVPVSAPWAGLAETLESSSPVAKRRALEVLRRGEVEGLRRYTDALRDTGVDPVSKDLIRSSLLPRQREHVRMLSTRLDQTQ